MRLLTTEEINKFKDVNVIIEKLVRETYDDEEKIILYSTCNRIESLIKNNI